MGSFYQNGIVNIVSNAKDTAQGFLFLERYLGLLPYDINHPSKSRLSGTLYLTSDSALHADARRREIPAHSPALDRGWVVQEQMLSQRAITFCFLSCTWTCQEFRKHKHTKDEDVEYGWWKSDIAKYVEDMLDYTTRQIARFSAAQRFFFTLTTNILASPDICFRALDEWRGIVEYCSGKDLSFGTDKLPAVSGLAKIMGSVISGEYLAGIWERDLPLGLLWGPSKGSSWAYPKQKSGPYVAPS